MNHDDGTAVWCAVGGALLLTVIALATLSGVPNCGSPPFRGPVTAQPLLPDGGDVFSTSDAGVRVAIRRIPRIPGVTLQVSPTTLRVFPDGLFQLAGQDSSAFYVQVEQGLPARMDAGVPSPPQVVRTTPVPVNRWHIRDISNGLPRQGQWRQGFDVADLDGDGDLDLVHGPARKGNGGMLMLLNDGHGAFTLWRDARLPPVQLDYGDVAAADFDGNGLVDVALGIHLQGVVILLQTRKGQFVHAPSDDTGAFSSRAVAAADVDGDGRADVVALSDGPRPPSGTRMQPAELGVRAYLLTRDGSVNMWRQPADVVFGDGLATGDVDGDGKQDVLLASRRAGANGLLRLSRGGQFESRELPLPSARALVDDVALTDLDGDGPLDAVLGVHQPEGATWRGTLELLLHPASQPAVESVALDGLPVAIAAHASVVAVALEDGRIQILERVAGDHPLLQAHWPVPAWRVGCKPIRLAWADLDGRPGQELVASFAGEGGGGCQGGGGMEVLAVDRR